MRPRGTTARGCRAKRASFIPGATPSRFGAPRPSRHLHLVRLVRPPHQAHHHARFDAQPVREVDPGALVRERVFVVPPVVRLSEDVGEGVEGEVHRATRHPRVGEFRDISRRRRFRVGVEHHVKVQGERLAQDAAEHAAVHRPRRAERELKRGVRRKHRRPVKILHQRQLGELQVILHVLLVVTGSEGALAGGEIRPAHPRVQFIEGDRGMRVAGRVAVRVMAAMLARPPQGGTLSRREG